MTKTKIIIALSFFSIAMAALESAVVVYLRALYYPDQFTVAFKLMDEKILLVEIIRELATIVMLCCAGYLAGKNFKARLAYFLLCFAIWDIFYYVWLKVFIDWPSSAFEWDILFLIPFTWLGPVLAPLICSVTMIALAFTLLKNDKPLTPTIWSLLIVGSLFILYTFMEDYGWIIISNGFLKDYARILQNQDFLKIASGYIPATYNWSIFWLGEIFLIGGIVCLNHGLNRLRDYANFIKVQTQSRTSTSMRNNP